MTSRICVASRFIRGNYVEERVTALNITASGTNYGFNSRVVHMEAMMVPPLRAELNKMKSLACPQRGMKLF